MPTRTLPALPRRAPGAFGRFIDETNGRIARIVSRERSVPSSMRTSVARYLSVPATPARLFESRSERIGADFAGADAPDGLHRDHPVLAVADGSRPGVLDDRGDDLVG